jgi:hypothetical protein
MKFTMGNPDSGLMITGMYLSPCTRIGSGSRKISWRTDIEKDREDQINYSIDYEFRRS